MEVKAKEVKGDKEILFWNVAGLGRHDKEFWRFIGKNDFISLCETWLEERSWNRIRYKLPSSHKWYCIFAKREVNRGRARGGFLIGIKKSWNIEKEVSIQEREEGVVMTRFREKEQKRTFVVISVYSNRNWKKMKEAMVNIAEENREEILIVGGDFNARIGLKGGNDIEGWDIRRKSKDEVVNVKGKELIDWVADVGGVILNGTTKGDEDGEFTYIGPKGASVIDYAIVNENCMEFVNSFKVEERVDSDHMPLRLEIMNSKQKEERKGKKSQQEEEEKEERRWKISWSKQAIKRYRDKTNNMSWEVRLDETLEEKWIRLKGMVHEAMVREQFKQGRRPMGFKSWWDGSCTRKKRKVQRTFKRWRKGKISREEYIVERKSLRKMLEEKMRMRREEEEQTFSNLRNAAEVWKIINVKRGKRGWIENNIEKKTWEEHFMRLLEGRREEEGENEEELRKVNAIGSELKREEEGVNELELEEEWIWATLRRMKKRKAAGHDGIPMEAWIYAGKAVRVGLAELLKDIWKNNKAPREWKTSIVVPLFKKGDQDVPGNYRGISLLCTAYKVYAEILRRCLEQEIEGLNLLPESQGGFRKGRGTIENIFVLDHLIQREKREQVGELFAAFIDVKAAFDNVDRHKLWKVLEEKGISIGLINRIRRLYEGTKTMIRTEEGLTDSFCTSKGVRQGCVLSPALFNLYMADLDNFLCKRGVGGIKLGNDRVWTLGYADDLVLLAKNRVAILDMLSTLGRFLKKRSLTLNVDKTKMLIFNRKDRGKKERWLWEGKEIEEVQTFSYLGFKFNRNGDYNDHIRGLYKKGRLAANKVWGIGERLCRNDFLRRWMLFNYLVKSVMGYGVELWGWSERRELERVMWDYIRWVFRLKFCTPRYLIHRELRLDKMKVEWGIRARRFEEKIRDMEESRWVKKCWREKQKEGWKDLYGKERERYYNRNGWGLLAIDSMAGEERDLIGEIISRENDTQRQWEERKIKEARYNKRYREILEEERGTKEDYLSKENVIQIRNGDGIRALFNIRCGNIEGDNKYWLKEEERNCVFCKEGRDNLKHFIGDCQVTKEWFKDIGKDTEERLSRIYDNRLDEVKEKIIIKVWREREKLERKDSGNR